MFRRRRLGIFIVILFIIILYYRSRSSSQKGTSRQSRGRDTIYHLKISPLVHTISDQIPLPKDPAKSLPAIQYDFTQRTESAEAKKIRLHRKSTVEDAFLHAWDGYKFHAFAKDEVSPISGSWRNSFGGWGATMVDTMDLLWLMGMQGDFDMSVDAVSKIDFTTNVEDVLNVFETNIRYLGGLLAAYDISGRKYSTLLQKAIELGDLLYMAFDTPNHMPMTRWQWKLVAQGVKLSPDPQVLLAELGSMSLEFTRLSQLTGDSKYFDAVQRISRQLYKVQNSTQIPGLWPTVVDVQNLDFSYNHFTMGGMVDSAYEYLLKEYLLLGGLEPMYETMYRTALAKAKQYLFYRPMLPDDQDILFSGNAEFDADQGVRTDTQSQHLSCFLGGMVAIGAKAFDEPFDLAVARKLVKGCVWAYRSMPSGLMPEIFRLHACHIGVGRVRSETECVWDEDEWLEAVARRHGVREENPNMSFTEAGRKWVKLRSLQKGYTEQADNRYLLRPEAIESIFILYRITGDDTLLDDAWEMFQAIERATRTRIAHASVHDVRAKPDDIEQSDRMESFWLAETLKYFWLIFADPDIVNLDDWVLNTEAHMFRRPQAGKAFG